MEDSLVSTGTLMFEDAQQENSIGFHAVRACPSIAGDAICSLISTSMFT